MDSTIVIKVKYEETLRRFSARVINGELDLDMYGLTRKIFSLFNMPSNTVLSMTYVDEDGDVITLSDDEDLRDVMKQSLNPLRITVTLNTDRTGNSHAKSSEVSSPRTLPRAHEVLKALPGPINEAITKLSTNLVSSPAPSSFLASEVVDLLSKMGLTYLKQVLDTQNNVGPHVEVQTSEILPGGKSEDSNLKENESDKVPRVSFDLNVMPSLDEMKEVDFKKKSAVGHFNTRIDRKMKMKSMLRAACASSGGSSQSNVLPNLSECPFSGTVVENTEKSRISTECKNVHVFHKGVRCDGCGVHPIFGIRFKSKVQDNYDLCSICFEVMGNLEDYIRIERPHYRMRPPVPVKGNEILQCHQPILDNLFIQDVSIRDGTVMAPSTPFAKIWRMKNTGSAKWPCGTQLLYIGGDTLNAKPIVEIEIPADGFPKGKEIDISVKFVAPEAPGRYISYWRMVSPKGQKFGQRIWVLIQVDASLSLGEARVNLSLPLVGNGYIQPWNLNLYEPIVTESQKSDKRKDSVEAKADTESKKELNTGFPVNDTLLVGGSSGGASRLEDLSAIPPPLIDYSEPAPQAAGVKSGGDQEAQNDSSVKSNELEILGFTEFDLNKEIPKTDEFNGEWKPILVQLSEMGFCDDETNKMLLKKNNGSIKRVVMELLAEEGA
jgi:next-to-BRCA1 protein 1